MQRTPFVWYLFGELSFSQPQIQILRSRLFGCQHEQDSVRMEDWVIKGLTDSLQPLRDLP